VLAALATMAVVAQAPRPAAQLAKAYRGDDGQRVELIVFAEDKPKRGLLRVTAALSEVDGLVVPVELQRDRWVARLGGGAWSLAVELREPVRRSNRVYVLEVFPPGAKPFIVWLDEVATAALKPEALSSALPTQLRLLALAQRKAWPNLEAKYSKAATEAQAALSKACGKPVAVHLDFAGFDDAFMADTDVWQACKPFVDWAQRNCGALRGATTLSCRGGATFALSSDGEALSFTTTTTGKADAARFLATRPGP
jgi:hypothetical protein